MGQLFVVALLTGAALCVAFDETISTDTSNESEMTVKGLVNQVLLENGLTGDFIKTIAAAMEKLNQQENKILELTKDVYRLNHIVRNQEKMIKVSHRKNEELKSFMMNQASRIFRLDQTIKQTKDEVLTLKQHSATPQGRYETDSSELMENVTGDKQYRKFDALEKNNDAQSLKDNKVGKDRNSNASSTLEVAKKPRRDMVEVVAFSVYLSKHTHYVTGQTVKYDQILTNHGNSYNAFTGVFSVPLTGTYLLTFAIATDQRYSHICVRLVDNNSYLVDACADPGTTTHIDTAGNTVIVALTVGHRVWVEVYDTSNGLMYGTPTHRHATFSGVFLF